MKSSNRGHGAASVGLAAGAEARGPGGPSGEAQAAKALGSLNTHLPHLPSPRPSHRDKVSPRCGKQLWFSQGGLSLGQRTGPRFPVWQVGPGAQ